MARNRRADGIPSFGERGQRWLARRLEQELPVRWDLSKAADWTPHLVHWYVERWSEHVQWRAHEHYYGPGHTSGAWVIAWDRVKANFDAAWAAAGRAVREAQADAARARDAGRFPTLDAWLEAEQRGELAYAGAKEPSVRDVLPDDQAWEVIIAARGRRRLWPRRCKACMTMFTPDRGGVVRCASCRASSRKPATRLASPTPRANAPVSERTPQAAPVVGEALSDYEMGRQHGRAQFQQLLDDFERMRTSADEMRRGHGRDAYSQRDHGRPSGGAP